MHHVHAVTQCDNRLVDLLGKLTSGGEDVCLSLLQVRADPMKDRDGDRSGFACAKLRLRDDILLIHDRMRARC